ncbi:MAG TPA: hypothetical protein VFU19_03925 [Iamia sp.]|nr:hypothetical protein [Iamia sp.]
MLDGDWDVDVQPLGAVAKIRFCEDHWTAGTPWSETGAIEHMHRLIEARGRAVDGCQDRSDIVARYRRLDRIFQQVEGDRRLMAHCERAPGAFREVDGIYMHFDRRGRPIFGLGGCHRLAIARIVGLEEIPVQVGVVHRQAIDRWEATARRGSRSIGRREWA